MSKALELLSKLGCTNHNCVVHEIPKGGMGTNGPCHCLRNAKPHELNTIVRLKNQYIKELQAKVDRLEAFLGRCADNPHDWWDSFGDLQLEAADLHNELVGDSDE